ncbi:MAG: hypothetical protein ABIL20_05895, partial [candidate division WOR-3 bacterium]
SVIFPIFLISSQPTLIDFALIYTGIFFGYVISPVHPCISVTCEYFARDIKGSLKLLTPPALIVLCTTLIVAVIKILQ